MAAGHMLFVGMHVKNLPYREIYIEEVKLLPLNYKAQHRSSPGQEV